MTKQPLSWTSARRGPDTGIWKITPEKSNIDDLNLIRRTARGAQSSVGDVEVPRRGLQVAMAKKKLERAQIGAPFQQVRRVAVPTIPHTA